MLPKFFYTVGSCRDAHSIIKALGPMFRLESLIFKHAYMENIRSLNCVGFPNNIWAFLIEKLLEDQVFYMKRLQYIWKIKYFKFADLYNSLLFMYVKKNMKLQNLVVFANNILLIEMKCYSIYFFIKISTDEKLQICRLVKHIVKVMCVHLINIHVCVVH